MRTSARSRVHVRLISARFDSIFRVAWSCPIFYVASWSLEEISSGTRSIYLSDACSCKHCKKAAHSGCDSSHDGMLPIAALVVFVLWTSFKRHPSFPGRTLPPPPPTSSSLAIASTSEIHRMFCLRKPLCTHGLAHILQIGGLPSSSLVG